MDLCERCGVELAADATYCRKCGRRTSIKPSWLTPAKASPEGDGPGNGFSTLAVFFGVVAAASVFVGIVAIVLASVARFRGEPSSRFAIAVSGCGIVLGLVLRTMVFDSSG
jgi:uncharacterized membrane protein YvbJ